MGAIFVRLVGLKGGVDDGNRGEHRQTFVSPSRSLDFGRRFALRAVWPEHIDLLPGSPILDASG
jgi:hypothetical protein